MQKIDGYYTGVAIDQMIGRYGATSFFNRCFEDFPKSYLLEAPSRKTHYYKKEEIDAWFKTHHVILSKKPNLKIY